MIKRVLPPIEIEVDIETRYNESTFAAYRALINDPKKYEAYLQWKSGVNPKTGRKITIGGEIHNKMAHEFQIPLIVEDTAVLWCMPDDIENIDEKAYLQETNDLQTSIDEENHRIKLRKDAILDLYNKVQKLKKWNDYVEFEGVKYGVRIVHNGIHMQDDCGGKMILRESTYRECDECVRGVCITPLQCTSICKENIYNCSQCGYIRRVL